MPENFDLFWLKFETLISFNSEKENFPKQLKKIRSKAKIGHFTFKFRTVFCGIFTVFCQKYGKILRYFLRYTVF